MGWPRFPLPEGHCYSNALHPRCHRGETLWESLAISGAQRRLIHVWGRKEVRPSGDYDGATMEAVGAVQRAVGLPVTGFLDEETWGVLWVGPPDQLTAPSSVD